MTEFNSNTIQVHIFARFPDSNYYQLELQRSDSERVYPGVWQVITGTCENNELAWQTAIRETLEETKLIPINCWTLPYVAVFHNPYKDLISASPGFAFEVNPTDKVQISNEHKNYKWQKLELPFQQFIIPSHNEGTKILIEYIINNPENHHFALHSEWKQFIKSLSNE